MRAAKIRLTSPWGLDTWASMENKHQHQHAGVARRPLNGSWVAGKTRRIEWNSFRIKEAWRGQEASPFFMGSRAIPGGPKQHTSVVEEAWRGQEAS